MLHENLHVSGPDAHIDGGHMLLPPDNALSTIFAMVRSRAFNGLTLLAEGALLITGNVFPEDNG